MRMNRSMADSLAAAGIDPRKAQLDLATRLHKLASSNFVEERGCLVLEPLATLGSYDPDRFHDRTGYECLANKIHVKDYLDRTVTVLEQLRQGVGYGAELGKRLAHSGRFIVILSVDRDTGDVVVRFHQEHPNESWVTDDLEGYETNDVLVWEPEDLAYL
jgi:hypothetical protein